MGLPLPPTSLQEPAQPKLGQTRCYWTLLTADLRFLHLDPVLESHLGEQADQLVGKPLLAFVHPEEQSSAEHDLGRVLDSRTLHGSVTRVRFSRLSYIRRRLGYRGPPDAWAQTQGHKIAVDSDYLAVDIVINWAAEGVVLCFVHAIVDLSPLDNDEGIKTDWSNWCGTPSFTPQQAEHLYRRLAMHIQAPTNMSRVFQVLWNDPDRTLLASWPPEQPHLRSSRELAKLALDVQIGNCLPSRREAKTSCTRRYKALHTLPPGPHEGGEVESIFIPYGCIIFACHKVNDVHRRASRDAHAMSQTPYDAQNLVLQSGSQQYYSPVSAHFPPVPSPQYASYPPESHPQSWARVSNSPTSGQYVWQGPGIPPQSVPGNSLRHSGSYSSLSSHSWSPTSGYMDHAPAVSPDYPRAPSPYYAYAADGGGTDGGSSNEGDGVPPPRPVPRRTSPGSAKDQFGGPSRGGGNPPAGIPRCSSCKATSSPEWRKGPSGKKDLCNACGLRYARSRAKKDGVAPVRRKKTPAQAVKEEDVALARPPSVASSSRMTSVHPGLHPSPSPPPLSHHIDHAYLPPPPNGADPYYHGMSMVPDGSLYDQGYHHHHAPPYHTGQQAAASSLAGVPQPSSSRT